MAEKQIPAHQWKFCKTYLQNCKGCFKEAFFTLQEIPDFSRMFPIAKQRAAPRVRIKNNIYPLKGYLSIFPGKSNNYP